MAPYDGSSNTHAAHATSSNPTTGDELDFIVDAEHSVLDQILPSGGRIDRWDGTLHFKFSDQQSSVRLSFGPAGSSYALEGTCTQPNGTKIPLTHQGNHAVASIPSSAAGASFTFDLNHAEPRTSSSGHGSGGGDNSGLRVLRAKLVFTTEEATPDPDALPIAVGPKIG